MANKTRTNLRQLVAQQFPLPFVSGTSTAGDATTVTDLPVLGAYEDNSFIGAWLYGTAWTVKDRRITDSVQSTGVVTMIPSDAGGVGTVAYEVLPFSGTAIHQALDESIREAYDRGWLVREVWLTHYVTGSPIYNSTFDYWNATSTVDGWTANTVTLTRIQYDGTSESAPMVQPGMNIIKFNNATGTFVLDQGYRQFLSDFRSHSVDLRAYVWSDTATKIRAQVVADGSVVGSTDYHSGGSTWEMVSVEGVQLGDSVDNVTVQVDLTSGTTNNHVAAIWLENGPIIRNYPFPIKFIPDGPNAIYASPVNIDSSDKIMDIMPAGPQKPLGGWSLYRYRNEQATGEIGMISFFKSPPTHLKRLWMPCSAPLSLPTADTDVVEVDLPEDLLLAKMAALKLIEKMTGSPDRNRMEEVEIRLRRDVEELSKGKGASDSGAVPLTLTW